MSLFLIQVYVLYRAKTLAKEDVNRDKDTTPDLLPSGRSR